MTLHVRYVGDTGRSRRRASQDPSSRTERETSTVFDHQTQLRLIQEEREREIQALARIRLARSAPPRPTRHPLRQNAGRLLVRAGMWLIVGGAPEALRR